MVFLPQTLHPRWLATGLQKCQHKTSHHSRLCACDSRSKKRQTCCVLTAVLFKIHWTKIKIPRSRRRRCRFVRSINVYVYGVGWIRVSWNGDALRNINLLSVAKGVFISLSFEPNFSEDCNSITVKGSQGEGVLLLLCDFDLPAAQVVVYILGSDIIISNSK